MATPNVAYLTLGVEVISDTVRAASNEVNTRQAAIIAKVKGLGVADKDVQTANYSIFPYQPPEPPTGPNVPRATGGPPRTQYRVDSSIRVTVRDLSKVGTVIDGAVEAGANTVSGIQFGVDDPTPLQDQARGAAVVDARRRAQEYARAAGVTLGPPMIITEIIGSTPGPLPGIADAARGVGAAPAPMAAPPVEAGELTFTTRVQITFVMQ